MEGYLTDSFIETVQHKFIDHQPLILPSQVTHPKHSFYPKKHSSVALVLRVVPFHSEVHNYPSHNQGEEDKYRAELLFIKRSTRDTDKWSGHIAFPGGHVEPDDDSPKQAAERECFEEVGLKLDSPAFISLGRLDDRVISSWNMVISSFVFLQVVEKTPPLTLDLKEVQAAIWVPISFFLQHNSHTHIITPLSVPNRVFKKSFLFNLLGLSSNEFPSVHLPFPKNPPEENQAEQVQIALPSYLAGELSPDTKLVLWGLTLGITSDLLVHSGKLDRHLHHPHFFVNNRFFNLVIRIVYFFSSFTSRHPTFDRLVYYLYGASYLAIVCAILPLLLFIKKLIRRKKLRK
eukprot:TRINITY_DN660_c0_g1_i1.p1 TRINITY_DN660_c0_g1~~TRINITY_DN660_c0_g1_i1.p1  ORF type:complete len:346 (-),score=60.67 TRINITY_DN660_c0_g1_i1:129-1166(-)